MNKKTLIVLAGILLAAALILPVYAIIESQTIYNNLTVSILPDLGGDQTQISAFFAAAAAAQQLTLGVLAIAEVVLITLFLIVLWRIVKVR